jgi:hypothetical protein
MFKRGDSQKEKLVGGFLGPTVDFRHSIDMGETWEEPRMNVTSPSDNLFEEEGCLMGDLMRTEIELIPVPESGPELAPAITTTTTTTTASATASAFPPVGTIGNGTCFPTSYHGTDCDTHTSGYFTGVSSLSACKAKVSACKMGNILTWGAADHSCSWYSQCDFAHLCVDCSKDKGPNCPISRGQAACPHYFPFTSEVLRIPPPTPPTPPPPTRGPTPAPYSCTKRIKFGTPHWVSYV